MATPALVQHLPQPRRSRLGWVRRALGTHRGVCAWQSRGSARSWSLRRLRYPKATRCVFRCWHSVRKYIKPILERGQGRCKVVDTCDMICTSLDFLCNVQHTTQGYASDTSPDTSGTIERKDDEDVRAGDDRDKAVVYGGVCDDLMLARLCLWSLVAAGRSRSGSRWWQLGMRKSADCIYGLRNGRVPYLARWSSSR